MRQREPETIHVLAECNTCGMYAKGIDTPAFRDLWSEHMSEHGEWGDDTWATWKVFTLF